MSSKIVATENPEAGVFNQKLNRYTIKIAGMPCIRTIRIVAPGYFRKLDVVRKHSSSDCLWQKFHITSYTYISALDSKFTWSLITSESFIIVH